MADVEKTSIKENICVVNNISMIIKSEHQSDNSNTDKGAGDNEDTESIEEQPLDIGEHYLVRRSDDSWHPAEIIQTRFNEQESHYEYYVHYEGYNRRLDEWVPRVRIMSSRFDMSDHQWKNNERNTIELLDQSDRKITRNQKRRHDEINHIQKVNIRLNYVFIPTAIGNPNGTASSSVTPSSDLFF
uniref:Chromo domain-containing protein n=1 Tax=Clastoptera arizonana TaxID=38151 RepID=A0A1B6CTY5_9HEMI